MNNKPHFFVDSVQVGVPTRWSNEQSVSATFHNFEDIPLNQAVCSPPLKCLGNEWQIKILKTPSWLQVFLLRATSTSPENFPSETQFSLHVGSQMQKGKFSPQKMDNSKVYHFWTNNVLQSDGSLQIIAAIQVEITTSPTIATEDSIWTPPPSLGKDLLKMLESGKNADVVFSVDGTRFPAHKSILMLRAYAFQDLFEDESGNENDQEIPITGVQPSHFELLLHFIYSDTVPTISGGDAPQIIKVANRFGCIRLKLLAEAAMIHVCDNPDFAANMLLFADAHSCALLREKALDVFLANPTLVMASPGWTKLSASADLLAELMAKLLKVAFPPNDPPRATNASYNSTTHSNNENVSCDVEASCDHNPHSENIAMMKVSTLRAKLYEKGLDVDGTREMLVARLTDASKDIK